MRAFLRVLYEVAAGRDILAGGLGFSGYGSLR